MHLVHNILARTANRELARSFNREIFARKSTLAARLLKSDPVTRKSYYGVMKQMHLGANIPPLLEFIDKEARDATLISPFKLRKAFEQFVGEDLSVSTVMRRKELLREIILQVRADLRQRQEDNTPFGYYSFRIESKFVEQLEKISLEVTRLPYLDIFGCHALVHVTWEMKTWRWPIEPLSATRFVEDLVNTCTDLKIELSRTAPDIQVSDWDALVEKEGATARERRAHSLSGRMYDRGAAYMSKLI